MAVDTGLVGQTPPDVPAKKNKSAVRFRESGREINTNGHIRRDSRALPGLLGGLILFARAPSVPRAIRAPLSPMAASSSCPIVDRQDIRFVPVSADGGALQSGIVSIAQDNYGFLWLGGHGLYRYDGYSLKSYRHDPGDPGSLSDDTVMVVLQGSGRHSLDWHCFWRARPAGPAREIPSPITGMSLEMSGA